MMKRNGHPSALQDLLEQHLERWGLDTYRSATFLKVPHAYRLAPTMLVTTPKGSTLTLRASDVYGARSKFFARLDLEEDRYALTRLGGKLIRLYQNWLTTEFSERYRCLTTERQRDWLTGVVRLVIVRHLLEHKCVCSLIEGRPAFADRWVGSVMGYLYLYHRLPGEQARLVHHIVRDPDKQHALVEQFLDDLDVRMQGLQFVRSEPLPPLPADLQVPQVLLEPPEEGQNEQ